MTKSRAQGGVKLKRGSKRQTTECRWKLKGKSLWGCLGARGGVALRWWSFVVVVVGEQSVAVAPLFPSFAELDGGESDADKHATDTYLPGPHRNSRTFNTQTSTFSAFPFSEPHSQV